MRRHVRKRLKALTQGLKTLLGGQGLLIIAREPLLGELREIGNVAAYLIDQNRHCIGLQQVPTHRIDGGLQRGNEATIDQACAVGHSRPVVVIPRRSILIE